MDIIERLRQLFGSDAVSVEDVVTIIKDYTHQLPPKESLEFLLDLDNQLYLHTGNESRRHGNGTHSKHRHIKYHDFFTKNLEKGERVLDIGSSYGELVSDIAKKVAPAMVVGIEIEQEKVDRANATYDMENLSFIHGDATKAEDVPDESFDAITLSNVLEHIEKRPELLKSLIKLYNPKKVLIRVPSFERDWRVPLKKELGIDYRLDDTHFIEYTKETFDAEMEEAGLEIMKVEPRWGEIWAVLRPKTIA